MDARENEDKQKVSWTHALRQIVINCYKYHGREDLLPVFSEEEAAAAAVAAAAQGGNPGSNPVMGPVGVNPAGHHQQVSNDATEKKPTIIHNVVSNNATNTSVVRKILKINTYRKVANSSLSWLVARFQIFRRLMKFDAYVL